MNKKKRFLSLLFLTAVLLGIWFSPHPASISANAWQLFAIFTTTIMGIIFQPVPMGAIAIIGISTLLLTQTLTLEQGLSGFHNPIAWLVFLSFSIAKGIIKTGLGERVAYFFVSALGKSPLGLSYGLVITDFFLAPAIPSVTARAGGILYPVVTSLSDSFGSSAEKGTQDLIGSFLIKVAYQSSVITSAMFLTAMAGNPLVAALAGHVGISLTWVLWAKAAIIPGLISLFLMPIILYKFYPPKITSCEEAIRSAKLRLKEMGPLKKEEKTILMIFILLVVLWTFGDLLRISATTAALIGLSLLILTNILDWQKDVIANTTAWETFIWFGALIMMASFLNQLGFIPLVGDSAAALVSGLSWKVGFPFLFLIYFYSHYLFASNTAHIGAMYPIFLAVSISLGTNPIFAALTLAFASNLFGGLTHYGSGPAPLYFGSHLVTVQEWWRSGFALSIANLIIWIGIGSLWWKLLGLI
ncbi:Inner membrane protein ybhI,transporter, divalent anion:Na symporter (DASS) family,Sodium:sulfate symporter transmembrane region [Chlamydia serpentis]|uniref:Inner membrane protein ybhI,transporter, divalent anion:Na symporter (DASS) family,Sodium:sulfate symporter transmembrane region n=1 Tax=Chlamydia serpentis TaxID=1967782 RepID=A0A2R8FAH4_9CHLA|nr:anion permease [Chlamydia serpentis]SPN73361.1 Inner membrane protein ybhI,transporter, divalent anion:Na symporter (DASS) family,Sodium:sulfate symporter transmembrane region [Chlamydia serpentis]